MCVIITNVCPRLVASEHLGHVSIAHSIAQSDLASTNPEWKF